MSIRIYRRARLLFMCILALAIYNLSNAQHRKVVFVIVDGIPADLIEKLSTPCLDSIAKKGGYTRALAGGHTGTYTETPTISAVGYNTILTGTWVNKHNVWDNDIAEPNYNYPSIFRLFKNQYPEKKIAIFSSWLDNRTKLIGEDLPQTGHLKMDYAFDGLELDTLLYPHDPEKAYMDKIDHDVTEHAAACIRDTGPDLTWVYLQYTDDMGHAFGDSEPFYKSIREMDRRVGRIWQSIQYREQQHGETWQIYITTDHGRDSATGRDHGGQSPREKLAWIVTNARNLNGHFKSGNATQADIMPSIAGFLSIHIPIDKRRELDGLPLTGDIAIANPSVRRINDKVYVSWRAHKKKGRVKILLAATNHVRSGGTDEYRVVKTVKIKRKKAAFRLTSAGITDFKLALETKENIINCQGTAQEK